MLVGSQLGFSENWGWFWLKRRRDEEWRGVFVVRGRRESGVHSFSKRGKDEIFDGLFSAPPFFFCSFCAFIWFGQQRERGWKTFIMSSVLTVPHLSYIHVLDNNTNITRLEVGPQRFTAQQHERVLGAPTPFVIIPPQHYAVVSNPIVPESRDTPPYKLKWRDSE